ncbi:MAG: Na(+)-translocating NADH-quinone reductase subunit C [Acidobacteria bacterium]|nr:Na(+)-translocating NADH-quinone reductase subunit C [Acidobacteriota bacterium]
MQGSVLYNLGFATAICVACAIVVSSSAVSLRERQLVNQALDMQRNVLVAAGLAAPDEALEAEEIAARFTPIRQVVIDVASGAATDADPATFDPRAAAADPGTSRTAPPNNAGLSRVADQALVYELLDAGGALDLVVLPVHGLGLWGLLYGFVALDADLETIRGLTYYEHKETPGLGGEVDNPRWKGLWNGRKAFGPNGEPAIEVARGLAGPPADDPFRVDGLAGATMTSRGVTNMLRFWLDEEGFGPYLDALRSRGDARAATDDGRGRMTAGGA